MGSRILRVFPRRTSYTPRDAMAFVGDPPLERPEADEVHVSVTFTWDLPQAKRLVAAWAQYYPVVKLGGPGMGDVGREFTPGRYVKHGVTFTSRGCIRRCPWCLVPQRGTGIRLLETIAPGYIVQDDNLLACPAEHLNRIWDMLRQQRRGIVFAGGLDARLITQGIADRLRELRIAEVFLACDSPQAIEALREAVEHLSWLSRDKLRCYVLIGRQESLSAARDRLEAVWEIGCLPFAQLYRPPTEERGMDWPADWRQLARLWSRPAAMKAVHRG